MSSDCWKKSVPTDPSTDTAVSHVVFTSLCSTTRTPRSRYTSTFSMKHRPSIRRRSTTSCASFLSPFIGNTSCCRVRLVTCGHYVSTLDIHTSHQHSLPHFAYSALHPHFPHCSASCALPYTHHTSTLCTLSHHYHTRLSGATLVHTRHTFHTSHSSTLLPHSSERATLTTLCTLSHHAHSSHTPQNEPHSPHFAHFHTTLQLHFLPHFDPIHTNSHFHTTHLSHT